MVAGAQGYESPNAGPWRTVSDSADDKLMLMGHDAVAYFAQNAAVPGDPAIKAEFLASREKYLPQFGGFCANGIDHAMR